jgi:outer membrane protein assembly factor BamD (BamD/ComL family)
VRPRDLEHSGRVLLVALLIAVLGAGCRSHRAGDDAKSGPEVIYQRAQKSMRNGDYGAAIKQLEALQSRFRSANRRARRSST